MYGKDVRDAIASCLELVSSKSSTFSSTPKAGVATVDDLPSNGDTGVYVVKSTGHYYIYNDDAKAWDDCGSYQAALEALDDISDHSSLDNLLIPGINAVSGTEISMIYKGTGITNEDSINNNVSGAKSYTVANRTILGHKVKISATYTIDTDMPDNALIGMQFNGYPTFDFGYAQLSGRKAGTYTITQTVTLPEDTNKDEIIYFRSVSSYYSGYIKVSNFSVCGNFESSSSTPLVSLTTSNALVAAFYALTHLDSITSHSNLDTLALPGLNGLVGTDTVAQLKADGSLDKSSNTIYELKNHTLLGKQAKISATYTIDTDMPSGSSIGLRLKGLSNPATYLELSGKTAGTYTLSDTVLLPDIDQDEDVDAYLEMFSSSYVGNIEVSNVTICGLFITDTNSNLSELSLSDALKAAFNVFLHADSLIDHGSLDDLLIPGINAVDDKTVSYDFTGKPSEDAGTSNYYEIINRSVLGKKAHVFATFKIDSTLPAGSIIALTFGSYPDWSSLIELQDLSGGIVPGTYTIDNYVTLPEDTDLTKMPNIRVYASNYAGNLIVSDFKVYGDFDESSNLPLSQMSFTQALKEAFCSTTKLDNILDKGSLNSLGIQGINLLEGTHKDWHTWFGQDWGLEDGITVSNLKPHTNYVFVADLKSDSDDPLWHSEVKGKFADNTTRSLGTSNALSAKEGTTVYTNFNSGDATSFTLYPHVSSVALTTAVSCYYRHERLIEGTQVKEWTPAISEMPVSDALVAIFRSLQSKDYDFENYNLGLPTINVSDPYQALLASDTKSTLPFELLDRKRHLRGYVNLEWQGDSTKNLIKKSFKFKTYQDVAKNEKLNWKPTPLFYQSNSFNLKAYFTDMYGFRDSVCAEIYSRIIANNPTAPVSLLQANHYGTIQSWPCLLYFGGIFYGLMQMNTKSSSNLWNIDDSDPNQIALESNGDSNKTGALWNTATPTVDDGSGDFSLQSNNSTNAQTALQALASWIVNATDDEFKANIDSHIDLNSILDFVIFNWIVNNVDCWAAKNVEYITYDAKRWFMMAYDFDATLGNSWVVGQTVDDDEDYFFNNSTSNNLLKKIKNLLPNKLLARFNELDDAGALNIVDMQKIIDNKPLEIGQDSYDLDQARWGGDPNYTISTDITIDHIKYMIAYRKRLFKSKAEALVSAI
jgi:hypothetical protein